MINQILKRNKMSPECYRIYDYLCNKHIGKENSVKLDNLASNLNYNRRSLRSYITELINYPGNLKVVCRDNNGVYIASNESEIVGSMMIVLKKGRSFFEQFEAMKSKLSHDGQSKITFTDYEKKFVEAYARKESKT